MPRGKKTALLKANKNDSMKQISLMAFVKPVTVAEANSEPSTSAATNKLNPASSEAPETKKSTSQPFRSSTGDLVQPPLSLPPASTGRSHRKARRSNFVTQRRALLMEKRALEGRVDPISRQGDYDGLNYAPVHQNPVSSASNTFASQRARRMVQMAASQSLQVKPRPVKRLAVLEDDSLTEDSMVVGKDFNSSSRPVKVRRTVFLDTQEKRHLNDVLVEITNIDEYPERKSNSNTEIIASVDASDENIVLGDSLVKALDDEWSREFTTHLQMETKECVETSEIKERPWYRCRVVDFSAKRHAVVVSAIHLDTQNLLLINLSGTWTDTPLQIGDIFHLVPTATDLQSSTTPHSTFHLADDDDFESGARNSILPTPRLLVLHPEVLISGTTIANAAAGGCSRRAIIQQFWAENEALESLNDASTASASRKWKPSVNVMLVGSVVHEVFQEVVNRQISGKPVVPQEVLFSRVIKPSIVLQLYGLGDSAEEFCNALEVFLPKIDQWVKEHCDPVTRSVPSVTPVVTEVLDIEENVWCTKIGVKGKIDMSVLCRTSNESDPSLIPLELKTGKPSFSFEHQGQVLLYILMLSDRHADRLKEAVKEGWLVYLHQPDRLYCQSGLIKPQAKSFRGLIQTRNRLAASLKRLIALEDLVLGEDKVDATWIPQLPSPLDRERTCSWCPYLLTCGLFRGENIPPPTDTPLHQMLKDRVKHVSVDHKTFLQHWTRLQLLAYATSNRVDKVLARIAESTNKDPTTYPSGIRGLIIQGATKLTDSQGFSICLKRQNGGPITTHELSVGDYLIVSSDDGRHVGLCLAALSAVCTSSVSLTINTDRLLPPWVTRFRLDRYFSDKAVQINLSNLVGLMENNRICARLRQLIINRICPRFTPNLRKSTLLDIRRFLRPLNIHQRQAVLSVLMSKDYTLIEGFPGSGKTETLAALLRCLGLLGRRTLLVSHTHSAVDNVLLRLLKDSDVKFIRLGDPEKVHHLLRPYNLETLLSQETSLVFNRATPKQMTTLFSRLVKFVDEILLQATLIGCTALAASVHEALNRFRFDVVVVDEATQLLLPTAIGGLLKLEPDVGQFVLVGDNNQLPPLVQSNSAREGGFGTSLFAHLSSIVQQYKDTRIPEEDGSLGGCLVQLRTQYRMNSRILQLANTLFYNNKMECASAEVANRTLDSAPTGEGSTKWLDRVLSPKIGDSLIFLDTQSICKNLGSSLNPVEVDIVKKIVCALVQRGISAGDIGVIAPYRLQVDALQQSLHCGIDSGAVDLSTMVEVSTADRFQGRDKALIIVSFVDCLRQNGRQLDADSVGKWSSGSLLNYGPRLNVALTRARHKLILIGCAGRHSKSGDDGTHRESSVLEQMLTILCEMSAVVPVPTL